MQENPFVKWVESMMEKLSAKNPTPMHAPENGERVIGECSLETRHIWNVGMQLGNLIITTLFRVRLEIMEAERAGTPLAENVIDAKQKEINILLTQCEAVRDLFWATARQELNCFDVMSIGLRNERTIVEIPETNPIYTLIDIPLIDILITDIDKIRKRQSAHNN